MVCDVLEMAFLIALHPLWSTLEGQGNAFLLCLCLVLRAADDR
jgi:hypothetical protein